VHRWVREPELSARLVWPFLRLLRERGIPIDVPMVRGKNLNDPDARIPHRKAIWLLDQVALGTRDEAVGLHAAERLQQGDFDILEYAAASTATMGESVVTANRYMRLVHDATEFSLEVDGESAMWRFGFSPDVALSPPATEYFTAIVVLLGRRFAGCDFLSGGAVHFTHPAPRDSSEHQRIFGNTVRFGQSQNAIAMPLSALSLPMVRSDPALRTLLERVAGEMLDRLPKTDALTSQVRRLLAAELGGGDPGIVALAKKLHMTPRTLRRRLEEVGTTHRDVLEHLRKELALRYVGERSIGTSEVAFLLGYSNASAFHKAFKRWTGVSASEYRKRDGSKASAR
jgi:AraC-like DNA-binding protein